MILDEAGYHELRKKFRARLPKFSTFSADEGYKARERNYKVELCRLFDEQVRPLLGARSEEELRFLGQRILDLFVTRLDADNSAQNIVDWRSHSAVREAAKSPAVLIEFGRRIAELLTPSVPLDRRVSNFSEFLRKLEWTRGRRLSAASTRRMGSFLLTLMDSDSCIFIKTREIQLLFRLLKTGYELNPRGLSAADIEHTLEVARALFERLTTDGLVPRDLIDVQSFVWLALADDRDVLDIRLTAGAIENGYLRVPAARADFFPSDSFGGNTGEPSGNMIELILPTGERLSTDLRLDDEGSRAARFRAQLGSLFSTLNIEAGDIARIRKVSARIFELSFLGGQSAEAKTDDQEVDEMEQESCDYPLNQILFGPPGTGKTYEALARAVRICDPAFVARERPRLEIMKRFRELRSQSRIGMVTFHQSYSYEDFVEGIRPRLDQVEGQEGQGPVSYHCRRGIFKEMCELASGSAVRINSNGTFDPSQNQVWKMSLGDTDDPDQASVYDECIREKRVALGYGMNQNFKSCNDRPAVLRRLREKDPSIEPTDYNVTSVHAFKNQMKVGDIVVVSDGNHYFRAIGRITGEYLFVEREHYPQTRPVEWLLVFDDSQPRETLMNRVFSQATIYRLGSKTLKVDVLRGLLESATSKSATNNNYVLIIDEINRANISKVLGELITLLETDKRKGAENEAPVTLPYSGKELFVPSNLYIIGTMNTADRSISFMDAALRRRFHFEELMPDASVVRAHVGKHGQVGGVDVAKLLERMNARIERYFDRDHQLGHSYFLGVENLASLRLRFTTAIIPLLGEYFYGDWTRTTAVLGCPIDPESGEPRALNPYPLIAATELNQESAQLSDAPRFAYRVNERFLEADETELTNFFNHVIGSAA